MVTKSNPYLPPSPETTRSSSPGGVAASWLVGFLVAHVIVSTFRVALYGQALAGSDVLAGVVGWVETASRVSWLASLFLVVPTLVAYSAWIWSVNRAVQQSLVADLEFTPKWCVAACFLPVVNLVAPFRAVDELRAALAPRSRVTVRLWWGAWIASLFFGLASRLAGSGGAAWGAPIHDALWAASALALIAVVRALRRGLEHRAASRRVAA